MKKFFLKEPHVIGCEEIDFPEIDPQYVLVKTLRCGICGTDAHSYQGETIFGKVFPFNIGHEICGKVEAIGDDVSSVQKGDIVAINPFYTCGCCEPCQTGHENNCDNKTTIGLQGPGGFSDYVYVPASSAVKADSEDYDALTLVEPLSTVVYGYQKLCIDSTKKVLIKGVGPIGLMFLQLAVADKPKHITVTDFVESKLNNALKLGVDTIHCPTEGSTLPFAQYDVIIDCTGSISSMRSNMDMLAFGGQMMLFGICSADLAMEIKPFQLYQKDALIHASFALNRHSFRVALNMIVNNRIRTDLLIDKVVPRSELEKSILSMANGQADGKIIIDTTR